MATLKTFSWGWLIVSQVYSIIIMARHGGVQAIIVLEKKLRVYILIYNQQEMNCATWHSLRVGDHKACPYTNILSSIRAHLLQQGYIF